MNRRGVLVNFVALLYNGCVNSTGKCQGEEMSFRFAALLLTTAALTMAQEFRATLQGDVVDPSKSTIPTAEVMLRNIQTGIERTTATDSSGHYIFQFVVPGEYSLTAKAAGFKTAVREGIALSLNDNIRLDVELALGATAETVSVTAEVTSVQADTSSLGAVVNRETIDRLPLKGHSSLYIYNLTPGVVGNRYLEDVRPSDTGSNVLFSANGAPVASGDIAVDGVTNTVNVGRGLSLSPWVPSTEAVAEMKMQLGTLPAEYGRAGGYFTNIVIKSGTNQLHGSAYEHLRNSAMDANLFFPRGRGQKLDPLWRSRFRLHGRRARLYSQSCTTDRIAPFSSSTMKADVRAMAKARRAVCLRRRCVRAIFPKSLLPSSIRSLCGRSTACQHAIRSRTT